MEREEALELLRGGPEGVAKWNAAREEVGFKLPRLNGANLRAAKLRRTNLQGADLSGADLSGADLVTANLAEANLSEARLGGAQLAVAILIGADLRGADLRAAELVMANLVHANMAGADLFRADLSGANLVKAVLREANLKDAFASGTNIQAELGDAIGLHELHHGGPSGISFPALQSFGEEVPEGFLRGIGFDDPTIEFLDAHLGTPIRFYSAFISYSHQDMAFARQLHDRLQGSGVRCWRDEKDVDIGERIRRVVNDAIRMKDRVILCCSKTSLESEWVKEELTAAIEREREIGRDIVLPLDVDGHLLNGYGGEFLGVLKQRLAADFAGWEKDATKFDQQLERVVKALRPK